MWINPVLSRFFIKVSHSSCIGQTEGLGEKRGPLHIIVLLLYRGINFNNLRVEFGGLCSGYEIRKTLNEHHLSKFKRSVVVNLKPLSFFFGVFYHLVLDLETIEVTYIVKSSSDG